MENLEMHGLDKLNEKLASILAKVAGDPTVKVGFLAGTAAGWSGPRPLKDGAKPSVGAQGSEQPAAYIASILNDGDPANNLPPRPFWDEWIEKGNENWGNLMAAALLKYNYEAKSALEMCGLAMKEELQSGIMNFDGEPLKPGTIAAKGFDQPLIDSHNMLKSVDYRVDL
jgi:hypothetical protein